MNKVGGPVISTRGATAGEKKRLHRAARNGEYVRIAPGHFIEASVHDEIEVEERAVARIVAHAHNASSGIVVGRSAALLHELPVSEDPALRAGWRVEIGTLRGRSLRKKDVEYRSLCGFHGAGVETLETDYGSARVTDVLTTALDLARWGTLEDAVRALDHCLAEGLVTLEQIDLRVVQMSQVEGVAEVRVAALLATASSESPQESSVKVALWRLKLPPPLQQVTITSRRRTRIGRVDFFYPDLGLVIEYDGQEKYSLSPVDGESTARKEYRQTREYLRNGLFPVRITREDLANGLAAEIIEEQFRARLETAVAYPGHLWSGGEPAWRV